MSLDSQFSILNSPSPKELSVGKSALGRGFEGLIPTGMDVAAVATPGEQIKQMSVDDIIANPYQPRREFDEKSLQELADSILQHGIIQPLVVTPKGDNYRIVAGERRFRASKLAGLKKVPVIVRNHEELEELEIALVENVQRVDLSPLEQAVSIVRLRDQFSMSATEIAKKLGKAETTVSNIVRLLQLPKGAIQALQDRTITEGHARAILALKSDEAAQNELLDAILKGGLSVRAAEEFVQQHKINNKKTLNAESQQYKKQLSTISKKYGVKCSITTKKQGGSLSIRYKNQDELTRLLSSLETS